MEKIDRLGWAAGISFKAYGLRIGVRVNEPEFLERLVERFPPGWKPYRSNVVGYLYSVIFGGASSRPGVRRFNIVYGDAARLVRTNDPDEALDTFESALQLYVAQMAIGSVFVHAGVVGWRGRAIVIPGRSHTGKTTLVAELVRAGATYYSDEYAVLDVRGRVHPFAKPLALRDSSDGVQTKTPVETLGGKAGVRPLPVGLVVASEYRRGALWRPRQLSKGQGVLALLSHTISARWRPEASLVTLPRVAAGARILKGARGDAKEVAEAILRRLED